MKSGKIIFVAILAITLILGTFFINSNNEELFLKSRISDTELTFNPTKLLSLQKIGECIRPQLSTCQEIGIEILKEAQGKKALKTLQDRIEREDHQSFLAVQAYKKENGNVPTPRVLNEGFEKQHMLEGPMATYWNCFTQVYAKCYTSSNKVISDFKSKSILKPKSQIFVQVIDFLSIYQIGTCIGHRIQECRDIFRVIYDANDDLKKSELYHQVLEQDDLFYRIIQTQEANNGTAPNVEYLRMLMNYYHFFEGQSSPVWSCVAYLYEECFYYEQANPDVVPYDSGNSDPSDFEPNTPDNNSSHEYSSDDYGNNSGSDHNGSDSGDHMSSDSGVSDSSDIEPVPSNE